MVATKYGIRCTCKSGSEGADGEDGGGGEGAAPIEGMSNSIDGAAGM